MKKWITGLVLALLALLVTIVVLTRERLPFGSSNSDFAIENTGDISSIEIIEDNNSLLLSRREKGWMVNNSFLARESAVDFILTTIENIQIKSPVSDELFSSLFDNVKPARVIIRGKRKRMADYYIYRADNPSYGTVLRRSLTSSPFFVALPGYDYDPGSHFVSEEKFWMPYHIFKLEPDRIKRISLEYADPYLDDLTILVEQDDLHLLVNGNKTAGAVRAKLRRYISYYTYVPFERWDFDLDKNLKAGMLNASPEISIEVELDGGEIKYARLWTKYIETPDGMIPDTDRLFGTLNNEADFFVARYFDLDPLIKTVDYFKSD